MKKNKKRRVLSDIESMSGTGWMLEHDDIELECPECGEYLIVSDDRAKCRNNHEFEIERGVQYLVRIGDLCLSKKCQKCTNRDCGDYDDCKHGHNYVGKKK